MGGMCVRVSDAALEERRDRRNAHQSQPLMLVSVNIYMYTPYSCPFHHGIFCEFRFSHTYGPTSVVTLLMNSSMRCPPNVRAMRPSGTSTPASATFCSAYQHAPDVRKSGQFCLSMHPSGTASAAVIHGFDAFGPAAYCGGHDAYGSIVS